MAVNFPLNPVDEQRYPDLAAGEAPLENGRVYVYDAAKGIWNLDISEGMTLRKGFGILTSVKVAASSC
jgi:hypothetical protein